MRNCSPLIHVWVLMYPAGAIPYPELLAYAQHISTFSSAPPNFEEPPPPAPGGPLPKPTQTFNPPFPNEVKMRLGRLGLEGSLGPLGETHSVGRRTFPFAFAVEHG